MGVNFRASFARNMLGGASFRGWIYRCACLRFVTTDLVLIKWYEMWLCVFVSCRYDMTLSGLWFLQSRCQWPHGLRRGSAAARLLGLRVWIPPGKWMSVFCECCVLSGRGLCLGLVTRPEESYRVWCVYVRSWNLDNKGSWSTRAVALLK